MAFLVEFWQRLTAVGPPLPLAGSVAAAGSALGLVLLAWPLVRVLVTVCHEAGHAVVALLAGRRLSGIRVHSDTSGLTVTRGRPTGPGMVLTFFAGYPAASVVGLGVAGLAGAGHAAGALWLLVVLLALMLVAMRNFYGFTVVLAIAVVLAICSWYAPPLMLAGVAHGLAWLLLLAAPRPVIEVAANRSPGTDAARLAAITHLPRPIWILLWLIPTVGAAAWAVALLFGPTLTR